MSKLIAIRDHGSHSPLFLIHAVFGEIAYARELARHLKSDRPVFGLRPPKLDGTEPVARTMEAIAADYIAEIRAVQPNGPYCLAGHSFGGWVAFEMAQQLARHGETAVFLGLIDTYGKTALRRPEKVAPRVARHLGALHKRSLWDMAVYVGMRVAKNVRYGFAVACLAAREHLSPEIGRRFIKPPSYALRSDLYAGIYRTALRRYTPQPYCGNITTFSAMGLSKFHKQHWQPIARGELTVTEIHGGHQSIVCSPHSIELAASFDACLERAARVIDGHGEDAPARSGNFDRLSASGEVSPPRRKSMA